MTEDSWSEVYQWLGFSLKKLAEEERKRDDDTKKTLTEVLGEESEEGQVDDAGEDSDIEELNQKTRKVTVTSKRNKTKNYKAKETLEKESDSDSD